MSGDSQIDEFVPTLSAEARRLRDNVLEVVRKNGYQHYNADAECSCGPGCGEVLQEAEVAQRLLTLTGVPEGMGYDADLDSRVAEAVRRLSTASRLLNKIASAHSRETGPAGTVGDYCVECSWRWPCPTYLTADGERDPNSAWHPNDDEPTDCSRCGGDPALCRHAEASRV